MPLTPKDILDTAIAQGRKVVGAGVGIGRRLRREERDAEVAPTPAGSRAGGARTGTPTPGTTRTARASESGARKPAARSPSAAPQSKGDAGARAAAGKAAAESGDEVKDAAKS